MPSSTVSSLPPKAISLKLPRPRDAYASRASSGKSHSMCPFSWQQFQ
jgi:hypothetical protein